MQDLDLSCGIWMPGLMLIHTLAWMDISTVFQVLSHFKKFPSIAKVCKYIDNNFRSLLLFIMHVLDLSSWIWMPGLMLIHTLACMDISAIFQVLTQFKKNPSRAKVYKHIDNYIGSILLFIMQDLDLSWWIWMPGLMLIHTLACMDISAIFRVRI